MLDIWAIQSDEAPIFCYILWIQLFVHGYSLFEIQVAQFLRVNSETGLFFFDSSYRPVPLAQQYIGISEHNFLARNELLNEICYNKVSFSKTFLLAILLSPDKFLV